MKDPKKTAEMNSASAAQYLPLKVVLRSVGEPVLADFGATRCAIDGPEPMFSFWKEVIEPKDDFEPDKETLIALMLNAKLRPLAYHQIALGSLSECIAHPREIFRPVIVSAAYAFILAHNHPSGDPRPSQADLSLTKNLREGASVLQISFLDHVIVGRAGFSFPPYFSFRDAGLL